MCLAIPGKIVEVLNSGENPFMHFAVVEVSSVRRKINIELIQEEGIHPGDWVLVHVGFALAKISESEAREQLQMLAKLGEKQQALQELEGYRFGEEE
ncbi:HypC/HybG/HupF family hydrogenase formation chaperone [Candidatus Methylacidiphilum infernorum]|uniref:HypC/HybG/HupF family hydrogenase formation chaperone n=1 Tax=Candidatus Methylacidiphilum infernorum TaxID=511746 RepID=A0ABX7PWA2_9BACT|nr:HypC/HybG/HupF family hydrogenase formation chaperone [Candidatus Methylacidiphilum infernorum]QSR87300.1 HypC/HybG/HupF family hydrogenase formation chaperone [Candidatus Methylacidiphilum infernorum]